MEEKKSSGVNLEKERGTFLLMGFVVVFSIFFVLLEWNFTPDRYNFDYSIIENFVEQELNHLSLDIPEDIPELQIEQETEIPVIYEDYNEVNEIGEEEITEELPLLEAFIVNNTVSDTDDLTQAELEKELKENISEKTDMLPEFPGGQSALTRFIYRSVKYPEVARKQKIQGRVICSFVIEQDGKISEIKIEKSVYSFLDEEALRVLKTMPDWKPGLKSGKTIRVKYILPIYFSL